MRLTFTVVSLQGTVLGPLLFLIMVNEDNIPHAKVYKYVDDMSHTRTQTRAGQHLVTRYPQPSVRAGIVKQKVHMNEI